MPLTSVALPILLGIVACGLLVLLVLGKPHFARRGQRMASRAAIAVLLNLTVLGAVGALLNNEYAFYSSWGDLLGAPPEATPQQYGAPASEAGAVASATANGHPHTASPQALPTLAEPGKRLQKYEIDPPVGGKHQEKRKVYVYLPKDYDATKATTYPVILALHGLPGRPDSYGKLGDFYAKVDAAVTSGRLRAPIVVIPQLNPSAHADTECVNAPNGAQTETWLADTLPRWVRTHFRTAPSRQSWATWGYSFGGVRHDADDEAPDDVRCRRHVPGVLPAGLRRQASFCAGFGAGPQLRPRGARADDAPAGGVVGVRLPGRPAELPFHPRVPRRGARTDVGDVAHRQRRWPPALGVDPQDPRLVRLARPGATGVRAGALTAASKIKPTYSYGAERNTGRINSLGSM